MDVDKMNGHLAEHREVYRRVVDKCARASSGGNLAPQYALAGLIVEPVLGK